MRIVMDDAGDLPPEYVTRYKIVVVPINCTFGTDEYLTGVTLDHQGFYEKVRAVGDHNFPKTSQPTPYQYGQVYEAIFNEGEHEILSIVVGSKLSGTYDSAVAGAELVASRGKVTVFDSMAGSAAQGYMVIQAARMLEAGESLEAILGKLSEMRDKMTVIFMIDNLEYAVKGGRVGLLQSTIASMLRMKPIMKLKEGRIVEAGTVRTFNKALDHIVNAVHDRIGERPAKIAYIHANSLAGVRTLKERAGSKLNAIEEFTAEMGISVAVNLGPGALGIVAIPE